MGHEPVNPKVHGDDRLYRADARLKLVRAADKCAEALRELHAASMVAHPKDLLVLADGFPFPNLAVNVKDDIGRTAREAALWAANLHADGRFERLGTRRFPDHP